MFLFQFVQKTEKASLAVIPELVPNLIVPYADFPRRNPERKIDAIIKEAKSIPEISKRMLYLQKWYFPNTPFGENTLGGGPGQRETLTINLAKMDCSTMVDYLFAMAIATDYNDFVNKLREMRYENGVVSWKTRNHYSAVWALKNQKYIRNVSVELGGIPYKKRLDLLKSKGIEPYALETYYVPKSRVGSIIDKLKDGDIILFTVFRSGLDVGHEGIVRMENDRALLVHSSETLRKMTEIDLLRYLQRSSKFTGIIVLRPNELD